MLAVKLFLFLPFVFAFLLGVLKAIKNPIYIRRISKTFFGFEFLLSIIILFLYPVDVFNIFSFSFSYNEISMYLIFLSSLIFMLFSIFSKTFIDKLHKLFYLTLMILFGLINFIILIDNIFLTLALIFWFLILIYLISISFSKKEVKKNASLRLMGDLFWFFVVIALNISGFAKYFVINDIEFSFINIVQNVYHIDDAVVAPAFLGLLILVFRLLDFAPFSTKKVNDIQKTNSFVCLISNIASFLLGAVLLIKCYKDFDYLFYEYQNEISIFLIANLVLYTLLIIKQKHLFDFLSNIFKIFFAFAIFVLFCFEQSTFEIFFKYIIAIILAWMFCGFVFAIISKKFKSDEIEELKRIDDKTKLTQIFSVLALLNIAPMPLFALFSVQLISFMSIFSIEYDAIILNITPYILIASAFVVCACVFRIIYKILIEPVESPNFEIQLCSHQVFVFIILTFLLFLLSLCPRILLNGAL